MADDSEARLAALGLTLPDAPAPAANYVPYCLSNGLLFTAGQLSRGPGGPIAGRLGDTLGIAEGQKAAELACLNMLAQVKAALGSLDAVAQAVRITGYVNATPEFADHALVLNGASDLLYAVLGDRGRHARVAVGMASLPFGVAVEVDGIFAVR